MAVHTETQQLLATLTTCRCVHVNEPPDTASVTPLSEVAPTATSTSPVWTENDAVAIDGTVFASVFQATSAS